MMVEQIEVRAQSGRCTNERAWLAIARADAATRVAARARCRELEDSLIEVAGPGDRVHVSRSHSGDWVAVGVSTGMAIGVDIERVRPKRDLAELARFIRLDDAATGNDRIFFAHWTLREALAKCVGDSVLSRHDSEPDLLGATRRPGRLVHAAGLAALCGQRADDIYYALVLQSTTPGELIRCT